MPLYGAVVVGPPGAGKSTFCAGLCRYLSLAERPCALINLDPACEGEGLTKFAIDVRDFVSVDAVMKEQKLGPNGALRYCLEQLWRAAVAQATASSPAAETAVEAPASAAESTSGPAADFCAVYLGDDVADEDAFRAVASLGGIGIKVADGQVPRTSTAATWSVPQPQVVELLRSFLKEEAQ